MDYKTVQSICCKDLNFTGNQEQYFKKYVKKGNMEHLPTQMAYKYAENIMNNFNSNGNVAEMNKKIKQLEVEIKEIEEDYDELETDTLEKMSDRNITIKNQKTEIKKYKEYDDVINTLPEEYKKLFSRGPSCFEN